MRRSPTWLANNRAIRAAVAEGILTDDDRRVIVRRETGHTSLADCSAAEITRVRKAIDSLSDWGKINTRNAGKRRRAFAPSSKPYIRKIHALWTALADAGGIRAQSRRPALTAFVKRQTGIDQVEWLTPREAATVIEALKAMLARTQAGS